MIKRWNSPFKKLKDEGIELFVLFRLRSEEDSVRNTVQQSSVDVNQILEVVADGSWIQII